MKSFSILGGKAHVVELPEINGKWQTVYRNDNDKNGVLISDEKEYYDKWGENSSPRFVFDLPPGNWRIIGMLSAVTEEQADMLVEKVMNGQHYQNYNYKSVIERWVKTALESLESAIRADGWCFENPYGTERPPNLPIDAIPYDQQPGYRAFRNTKPHLQPNDIELSYEFYCLAWQKAQSRVLDRSRCLLLGREG